MFLPKSLCVCSLVLLCLFVMFVNCVHAEKVLLNKCCDEGKVLSRNLSQIECVDDIAFNNTTQQWYPILALSSTGDERVSWSPGLGSTTGAPCAGDMQFASPLVYFPEKNMTDFVMYSNGSIVVKKFRSKTSVDSNLLGIYSRSSYCIDSVFNRSASVVFLCPCSERNCVHKCCELNQISDLGGTCFVPEHNADYWKPRFYDTHLVPTPPLPGTATVTGYLDCAFMKLNDNATSGHKFFLKQDGSVHVPLYNRNYTTDKYCLEMFEEDGTAHEDVIICFPETSQSQFTLYGSFLIISSVFLLATFLVYVLIPELMNLHGKTLVSHVASLFLAYVFLATNQLAGKNFGGDFCKIIAFMIQYTFLSAFFWLNVMCVDIWVGLSGMSPLRGTEHESEKRKFLYYSLYAWGFPLLISIVTGIVDFSDAVPVDCFMKPGFGTKTCWFDGQLAILVYFYGPIACLLIANIIIFSLTTWKINAVRKQTAILNHKDSKINTASRGNNADRERMWLIFKLFILMGITWVTEVISWAILATTHTPSSVFYVTDFVNLLQGVLIFVMFVLKKRTRKLVMSRFTCLKKLQTLSRENTRESSPTKSSSLSTAVEMNAVKERTA